MAEALVVLQQPGANLQQLLGPAGMVTQSVSDRVAVVDGSPETLERLRANTAVANVVVDAGGAEALPELDPSESLFVDAWKLRQRQGEKQRPGDNLPWDAPGRQPP